MLKHVLRANGLSCLVFGAVFVLAAPLTAATIGTPPHWLLQGLGGVLLVNAALLLWAAAQPVPARAMVLFFALGDALWVGATLVLIATGLWVTTPAGIVLAIGVALFVGACGLFQWKLAPARPAR